jgi:hypothetical protein
LSNESFKDLVQAELDALVTALPRLFSPDSLVPKMGLRPMKVLSGLPVEASMSRTSTFAVAKETSSTDVSEAFEASRLTSATVPRVKAWTPTR